MKKIEDKTWSAYGLAWSLGYSIITPILVFGIGGVLLDKYLDSFPIFVLVGFFLAMTASLTIVYIKTKDIIAQGTPPKPKK
ncbi:AtpZ/AtpI family protein [Candidatus Peregrinibacteria bacterium]|jgi:F0F1-type ATP synthase assembly protein I|nr:AtpZ/AtpI family protein [Candidatus Peregrinibacteria bacterium]MBT4148707.1 AtpZ/AtpI family protein [Candidatus Peregrinibacteria bacterium]MBT4366152.1 AtpZ/AtpI family protein [Candidatus Peregrinibacteria bacterium]MBT4456294.1 AtpZ/AtpI family protein [Candidatus Peregrinibacteria bacterium]